MVLDALAMLSSVQPGDAEESVTVDALLQRAAATVLTRPAVQALAASVPVSRLRTAFEQALSRSGPDAATALAFALAAAGERVPAEPLLELLVDIHSIAMFAPLVAMAEGDRVGLLLEFVERGHASWEREALALFLATRLLEGRAPPPALHAHLRSLAREPLEPGTGAIVGVALRALGDPTLQPLIARLLPPLSEEQFERMAAEFAAMLPAAPLDALPDREAPRAVSGYTVVRAVPKVGRNDPCPCGSGKKYKRCCAAKEEEGAAYGSPAQQFARVGEQHPRVRDQLFDLLRPSELARQDPEKLTGLQLIRAVRKLAAHRQWDAAARFAEALGDRNDLPSPAAEYHHEIADQALEVGAFDVAARHFELSHPSAGAREDFEVELALRRNAPDALQRLESLLASALRAGDAERVIDCAHVLLERFPALGILAARGAISAERVLDSEFLLESIERARDRLLLDPHEPWWGVLDLLESGRDASERRSDADAAHARERDRLHEEIDRLREAQRQAGARAESLQAELATRLVELERLGAERSLLAQQVRAAQTGDPAERVDELERERQRLRKTIDDLERAISSGAAQRGELRRELKRLSALQSARSVPTATAEAQDNAIGDDGSTPSDIAAPRRIAVPIYLPAAAKALGELPKTVATHALRAVAALAGGDPLAWAGVKRMRSTPDIYSARVGRSHRLLFRLAADQLEVADVIDRKALDATLRRR